MSSASKQSESELKGLLTSWKVKELYNLLRDEEISVEDFKIIKYRHVDRLLENQKLGTRIRFEHHLEQWRLKFGRPLLRSNRQDDGMLVDSVPKSKRFCTIPCQIQQSSSNNLPNQDNNETNSNTDKRRRTTDDESQLRRWAFRPIQVKSEEQTLPDIEVNNEAENEATSEVPLYPEIIVSNGADETLDTTDIQLSPITDGGISKIVNSSSKPDGMPVSLSDILYAAGDKGLDIITHYEKNNELTDNLRYQLIQLIVEFFDENNYALSSNISHILEEEIIKMFPTEKRENYRTETKGKIHIKYYNVKRLKREKLARLGSGKPTRKSAMCRRSTQLFNAKNAADDTIEPEE